jgi:surface polysaccharide O-acyltransferase-like enzyme
MKGDEKQPSAPLSSEHAGGSEDCHVASSEYHAAFAYLRAFIIVLVIIHHTAVAYFLPTAPPPASSLAENLHSIRAVSPVIDVQHSKLFFFVVFFNDRFFMPLMFLLSGLFLWGSLHRKGKLVFFRDRLVRLGLPFVVMVLLAPLTYYTTYLQPSGSSSPFGFWKQWFSLGNWPTGPAWFIWLLLAFDIFAIFLSALLPSGSDFLKKIPPVRRPAVFFWLLVILSAASYMPMATIYDPNFSWWYWGPFSFQLSRVFLYLLYFLIGVILGAYGIQRTLLVPQSALARRWVVWVVVTVAAFLGNIVATFARANQTLIAVSFLLFCASACFAFLSIFLKFFGKRNRMLDSLFRNSYGIYVIHYVVVNWLLFAMLTAPLPAIAKGPIVFLCSLMFCWGTISVIRRIPGVARVI